MHIYNVLAESSLSTGQDVFDVIIERLATSPIFADVHTWEITEDPWRRPIRPNSLKYFKFEPTTQENHLNYAAFTLNRLLTALNELSYYFLPPEKFDRDGMYSSFYNENLRTMAALVVPQLETYALGFVAEKVSVSGDWDKNKFKEYFEERIIPLKSNVPESLQLVEQSRYPVQAVELLLMQHAVDFLIEASHMGRYALGDYGELQSQLFRILLDEFGYGVHKSKHSTLFKDVLQSVELYSNSHAYWQFYLNTTLLLNNYFHHITRNPEHFFKYIGAITLAENTFGPYCKAVAHTLQSVHGDKIDTRYYLEHAHIDKHHARMTYEDLLLPAIDRYGEAVIPEIVLGMEQTLYLQKLAEEDLCTQLTWMSKKDDYHELGMEIRDKVLMDQDNLSIARLIEPKGELSVTHVHDGDELCIVDQGVLRFVSGPNSFVDLQPGQAVVIQRNRLHGAIVLSDVCHYNIYSIKDYRRYADREV